MDAHKNEVAECSAKGENQILDLSLAHSHLSSISASPPLLISPLPLDLPTRAHSANDRPAIRINNPKKRRPNFPKNVVDILKTWLKTNRGKPFPSRAEKKVLREQTGLDSRQVSIKILSIYVEINCFV
jgi:hypothetical protein